MHGDKLFHVNFPFKKVQVYAWRKHIGMRNGKTIDSWEILETTWKQARNETLKVHEMEQLY